MIPLRTILLLLVVTGLSWAIPQSVPDHKAGFPEYEYEYETGGDYEDEGDIDYGDPPQFAVSSQTFTKMEGDAVTMPCMPANEEHLSENSHYTLIIKKVAGATEKTDKTLFLGTSKVVKDSRIKLNGGHLEISRLRRRDAGEYVCYFEHPTVVEVRHTLFVHYPPRTTRLSELVKTVGMKDSHVLRCEAEGNPVPVITWSRADGGEMPLGAVIKEADESDYRKQSSLTLVVSDRHAEGTYICSAANGIGQPSTVNMTLRVSFPPEISLERDMVHSGLEDHVQLNCLVYGRPKPKVAWTHNDHAKLLVTEKPSGRGHMFTLNINSLKNSDFGDYVCSAVNNVGKNRAMLTITDEPSAPEFTSDPNGGEDTTYVLTWNARSYYNITKYTMKCREWNEDPALKTWPDMANYTAGKADMETNDDLTSFTVTLSKLQPATDYVCYVRISNDHKYGPGNNHVFSTKKNQVVASQSTSDGIRISSFGVSIAISLLIILNV